MLNKKEFVMEPKKAEKIDGYTDPSDLNNIRRISVGTNRDVWEEVFTALRYISDIESEGKKLFSGAGKNTNFFRFQSFIRQPEVYYQSAKMLHFRAASLNYYYSFLNLAKAYIMIKNPSYISGEKNDKIYHGIKSVNTSGSFNKQELLVMNEGVFSELYRLTTGEKFTENVLHVKIKDLLPYISDISHETHKLKIGLSKNHFSSACTVINNSTKKFRLVMLVERYQELSKYKTTIREFEKCFTEVSLDKQSITKIFGVRETLQSGFKVFESKFEFEMFGSKKDQINDSLTRDASLKCLQSIYIPNYYDDDYFKFFLAEPLWHHNQKTMNEMFAIYLVIFYLGSIVRYQPRYLEKMLNSKESWLLEIFVLSSTDTLLRQLANLILEEFWNERFIYNQRS